MLSLEVTTSLGAVQALEKTLAHFSQQFGLKPVEIAAHLHGREGFVEVRISGDTLEGSERHDPEAVLKQLSAHVERQYGLTTVHYLLHMHSQRDESVGHLVVKINLGPPVGLEFTSEEFDEAVREYASTLPR
jgi:deferrochelatase/peroxidase EfeB